MTRVRVRAIVRAAAGGMIAAVGSVVLSAAFPDAHDPPPAGWTGPVFKLSQNYPATLPALEPAASGRGRNSISLSRPTPRSTCRPC